jgi:hypothetical protein
VSYDELERQRLDRLKADNAELRASLAQIKARFAGEPTPEQRRARFRVIDGVKGAS